MNRLLYYSSEQENQSLSDIRRVTMCVLVAIALVPACGSLSSAFAQQQYDANLYSGLRWRMIGLFRGGRVNAVSGVRGQPNTFYFGSVGGGVWKSTNSGRTWMPVFDSQPIASIGAIGVAPSSPNIVYVGTGEADMRSQISYVNGMYKSTDAGKTWSHIGLDNTRQIGRVIVDPKNPNIVFDRVLPGLYTVKLTVSGKSHTQPLAVKMDPRAKCGARSVEMPCSYFRSAGPPECAAALRENQNVATCE